MPSVTKQNAKGQSNGTPPKVPNLDRLPSAWELADSIKMLLYGKSGTGKTTLWATFPGPILALICSGGNRPGELRSINTPELRSKINARVITSTETLKSVMGEAEGYATVVLDHASGLQDLTLKEILRLEELPAQKSWGMATREKYGQSGLMCKELFRRLLSLPGNLVVVAHERSFNSDEESDIIAPTVGAGLSPSVTGWLNGACDYVVQTYLRTETRTVKTKIGDKVMTKEEKTGKAQYCLRTEPHEVFLTKFRVPKGGQLPECIVDPTYAKILELINGASKVQTKK